jgi:hypothetical protein
LSRVEMYVGAGTSVDPHGVRIGDDGEGGRCSDEVTVRVMPGLPSAGCAGSKDVRVDDEGRGEGYNDRHIRGYSERTCPPMPPEDGRFDPTSCTSFDAS